MNDHQRITRAIVDGVLTMTKQLGEQAQVMQQLSELAKASKRIVRDPVSGKALGVEAVQ